MRAARRGPVLSDTGTAERLAVGASLLPGPATGAAYRRPVSQLCLLTGRMAGDSVLRRTGVKRDTRRALSTLSLWHVVSLARKGEPPKRQCQGQKAPRGARWPGLFSALLLSGPVTLGKGLNFPRTLGSAHVIEG